MTKNERLLLSTLQNSSDFPENLRMKCKWICSCYVNIRNWATRDKQLVLILQLGYVKMLQKKRVQQYGTIKRAQVKPQTNKNNVLNVMEIWHLRVFCIHLRRASSLVYTDLMFSSPQWSRGISEHLSHTLHVCYDCYPYTLLFLPVHQQFNLSKA